MSETTKKKPEMVKKRTSKEEFLIESLKLMVDGIAHTFGSRCEVVLHDFRRLKNLEHSIIKIVNGQVTGRTIGGSITNQVLKDLKNGRQDNLLLNYASVTKDGRPIKSTSIIFRDERKRPIAALGINFDLTDVVNFNAAIQDIFQVSEETQQSGLTETFESDVTSTLNGIADKAFRKVGRAATSMSRKGKLQVIRELENQGFFIIKGAVKLIASRLGVSKFTIYNYLEQIRGENQAYRSF